jgi:GcrA cell cycle regulator
MSLWSAERDAQLRALWAQDAPRLSATKIGAAMGLTKNAVVGRAHRLLLPSRPSPITCREAYPRTRKPGARPRNHGVRTLLARGAAAVAQAREATAALLAARGISIRAAESPEDTARTAGGVPAPCAARHPIPAPAVPRRAAAVAARGCRFPLWRNGARADHRYCDGPVACGAYCEEHAARCYQLSRPLGAPPPAAGWSVA